MNNYYIIRTESAGVHAGTLVSRTGNEVVLSGARRIWYWYGAASLSELSQYGLCHKRSKVPCVVPEMTILGVIEVIPCSDTARESITTCPVWSARDE